MPTPAAPAPPDIALTPASLLAVLDALARAHRQELTDLAQRADEAATHALRDDAWTVTPGTDALVAMRPDMIIDFTTDAPAEVTLSSRETPAPPARGLASRRWGAR
jgi:hypothetical protein